MQPFCVHWTDFVNWSNVFSLPADKIPGECISPDDTVTIWNNLLCDTNQLLSKGLSEEATQAQLSSVPLTPFSVLTATNGFPLSIHPHSLGQTNAPLLGTDLVWLNNTCRPNQTKNILSKSAHVLVSANATWMQKGCLTWTSLMN